jgi:AcrR family transcriptional regulator
MTAAEPSRPPRKRLSVEDRTRQLLEIAAEVFATVPYDVAEVEEIARRAGVSGSLIYHYFPTKRALFAAVVDQAIEELGRMTEPPVDQPPLERFRAGLDGYIDYVQRYEHAYRAMHRGRQSGDASVRAAIERNAQRQIARICAIFHPEGPPAPALELAVRGGLALTIAICLDWLEHRQIDREHLRELLIHAYHGAIKGATATPESTAAELSDVLQRRAA